MTTRNILFTELSIDLTFLLRAIVETWKRDAYIDNRLDARLEYEQEYNKLGKTLCSRLRLLGYPRYIEIDAEMDRLSNELIEKFFDLHWYILENSPKVAEHAAARGNPELKEWQEGKDARRAEEIARYGERADTARAKAAGKAEPTDG